MTYLSEERSYLRYKKKKKRKITSAWCFNIESGYNIHHSLSVLMKMIDIIFRRSGSEGHTFVPLRLRVFPPHTVNECTLGPVRSFG